MIDEVLEDCPFTLNIGLLETMQRDDIAPDVDPGDGVGAENLSPSSIEIALHSTGKVF